MDVQHVLLGVSNNTYNLVSLLQRSKAIFLKMPMDEYD